MDFTGTPYKWVRIDGVVKTDLPDSDIGEAAIESPTHGNVIFVRVDHGRSRVGFALSDELHKKYGDKMTQEQVIHEAQQAMKPWTCEFETVDWYTIYSIHQAVAQSFIKDDVFIIAGDAGHLHSSGAAQGMNTGIHDATNLSWKLAGVVKGYFDPKVFETYETERRPIAQHLIDLDKEMSALISGVVPDKYKTKSGEASMDPNELYGRLFDDSTAFNIGLGISYPSNIINKPAKAGMITPGHRAPDELLYAPGLRLPIRLQSILKYNGRFHIVVFAGEPLQTKNKVFSLRKYLDTSPTSIVKLYGDDKFHFTTIMVGESAEGQARLGCSSFGQFYFDPASTVHTAYGITAYNGAVMVFRPDGMVGYCTLLDCGEDLAEYFGEFMLKNLVHQANGSA